MGRPSWRERWSGRGSMGELLRLAWPLILTNSFWTLQILLDRLLLSRAGGDQVGAALATALLFWTPMNLFLNTSNYATTFVAQYVGAGQPRRVGPVVWQSLYFSAAGGAAFLALAPWARPLLALAGHNPHLQELEATYFRCLCCSALPTLLTASACSFFAGRGDSRTVLLVNLVGLTVNGVCAVTLIFGLWGFPALGIAGAGWATVLGGIASALLALGLLFRRRHRAAHATLAGFCFDRALFARLMRFGLPNGLATALDCLGFALFAVLIGGMGPVELDATGVAFAFNLAVFLPMLGIGQGVEILVGRRLGENDPATAERTTWNALGAALLLIGPVALVYALFPETLTEAFHGGTEWERVQALAPGLLRFIAVYSLFDGVNMVFSCTLRGAGDTRFVTAVALSLSWTVLVLPTWLAVEYGWGLYAAWSFASLYIIVQTAIFFFRFRQGKWRTMRVIEPALVGEG